MKYEDYRDFGLTDVQIAVRKAARKFAEKEILPVVDQYEREGKFPGDLVDKAAQLGYLGAIIPEEYGGSGLDYGSYGIICEEIARADWVTASVISVQNSLVGSSILNFGTEEQKEKYLRPMAQGEKLASAGLTEPGGGTDLGNLRTTVKRDGDYYLLNGSKVFISHASNADLILVFASIDRSLKHKGVTAFILDKGTPGLTVNPIRLHGLRRGNVCELSFEDCRIPKENLLGKEGEGFKILGSAVDTGRFSVASRCVGQAQACIDASIKYAKERTAFDQEIGKFQMIQQKIADMITTVEAARLLVRRLGDAKDAGVKRASLEASMAKMYASDVCMNVVLEAIQIHGGYGLAEEYPVGRYMVEAKALQIGEGTSELHKVLIAEYALDYRKQ